VLAEKWSPDVACDVVRRVATSCDHPATVVDVYTLLSVTPTYELKGARLLSDMSSGESPSAL